MPLTLRLKSIRKVALLAIATIRYEYFSELIRVDVLHTPNSYNKLIK